MLMFRHLRFTTDVILHCGLLRQRRSAVLPVRFHWRRYHLFLPPGVIILLIALFTVYLQKSSMPFFDILH